MRLKNVPGAREAVAASSFVVQEPEKCQGNWKEIFGNDHPVYIEVGMGKGRFLTDLALTHPENNYAGIERYSSVLFRACRKEKHWRQREPPCRTCVICALMQRICRKFLEKGK